MKKKYFGVISDSFSTRITYEINKNFYNEAKKELGKIFYINLNELIKGKFPNTNRKDLKFISKIFTIYTPKSYLNLENFLKNKNFIFSVSVGRTYKYFRIWYILKKTNSKLFYFLNLGILSTKINFYSKTFFENFKSRFDKFFNVYLSFKIYRLLVLLKVFPNIHIIFEASKLFANTFHNSPAKKIERILGIKNFALYQKIISINSRAYDEVIDLVKDINEEYIVFLDSGFDHPDRERFDKKATHKQRFVYYQNLKKILLKFSNIYKKKIIFCAHPKSNIKLIKRYLKNIKIVKFKTRFYILRSKVIFFHESSSVLDAIILKKKIWALKSDIMGKFFKSRNNLYPNFINCPSTEMSALSKFNSAKIKKNLDNYDFKLFNRKIKNYLVKNNSSLNYINKCIKNKKVYLQNKNNIQGRKEVLGYLKKFLKNKGLSKY